MLALFSWPITKFCTIINLYTVPLFKFWGYKKLLSLSSTPNLIRTLPLLPRPDFLYKSLIFISSQHSITKAKTIGIEKIIPHLNHVDYSHQGDSFHK